MSWFLHGNRVEIESEIVEIGSSPRLECESKPCRPDLGSDCVGWLDKLHDIRGERSPTRLARYCWGVERLERWLGACGLLLERHSVTDYAMCPPKKVGLGLFLDLVHWGTGVTNPTET